MANENNSKIAKILETKIPSRRRSPGRGFIVALSVVILFFGVYAGDPRGESDLK